MLGRSALAVGSALATGMGRTGLGAAAPESGPPASGSLATVDFTATTGRFAPAALWGFASGGLCNRNFDLCKSVEFVNAAASLKMPLLRLNSASGVGSTGANYWTDAIFRNGVRHPDWSTLSAFMNVAHKLVSPTCRLILGIKFQGSFGSPSDYAAACRHMALHFRNTPSGGRILPVWGFEVDNETNDRVDVDTYCSFFNAAAEAVHALDPGYRLIGTVDSYVDAARFKTFANRCGAYIGRLCYHNYRYCQGKDPTPSDDALFQSDRPALDARKVREAVAGTAAANVPILMGEWNMDCNAGHEPREQQVIAALFSAYWMLNGFRSGAGVDSGAMWELVDDSYYGAVQNGRVNPAGHFMSKAGQTMEGHQVSCDFTGNNTISLATRNGGAFGVMLVNYDRSATHSGTVGLSQRPGNMTGNGTISRWEISSAFPRGDVTTLPVANGVTAFTIVPPRSIIILSSGTP